VWPLLLLLALSGATGAMTGCDSAPLVSWWHSVVEVFGQASARGKKFFLNFRVNWLSGLLEISGG